MTRFQMGLRLALVCLLLNQSFNRAKSCQQCQRGHHRVFPINRVRQPVCQSVRLIQNVAPFRFRLAGEHYERVTCQMLRCPHDFVIGFV